jgi:hypothetical protein
MRNARFKPHCSKRGVGYTAFAQGGLTTYRLESAAGRPWMARATTPKVTPRQPPAKWPAVASGVSWAKCAYVSRGKTILSRLVESRRIPPIAERPSSPMLRYAACWPSEIVLAHCRCATGAKHQETVQDAFLGLRSFSVGTFVALSNILRWLVIRVRESPRGCTHLAPPGPDAYRIRPTRHRTPLRIASGPEVQGRIFRERSAERLVQRFRRDNELRLLTASPDGTEQRFTSGSGFRESYGDGCQAGVQVPVANDCWKLAVQSQPRSRVMA